MKITVFGASGKTGQHVIEKALDKGFQVLAYVRRENSLRIQHPNLNISVGNLNDTYKIEEAIKGADACISTLGGASLRKHATEVVEGIDRIVTTMEKQGVKRLMYLSSFGVGDSEQYMAPFIRFLIVKLILRVPIADHGTNEQRIQRSDLDWTIFRPGSLHDGPQSENVKSGIDSPGTKGNLSISRASLAAYMVNRLTEKPYIKQAIWLHEQ
ncbi:MAG: NAD(P)H-binding protein [Bacteroidales bacterium]|nr:NAD(P)H-binding protein [Bacteroidales bacterium]